MPTPKKKKKAQPKKNKSLKSKNDPLKDYPNHFRRAEIHYKNENGLLGTIKFLDEEMSDEERLKKFLNEPSQSAKDNFPKDVYFDLIKKIKNAKDKRKLRFDDFELRVLEKALENCCSYLEEMPKFNDLRGQLAFANMVFKNTEGRTDKKLRPVGRILGFTNSGKTPLPIPPFSIPPPSVGKQPTYDPEIVLPRYEELINSGMDKKKAVEQCAEEFHFASPAACGSYLREHGLTGVPDIKQSLHVIYSLPPSKSR
jgi:hypothetical protein